MTFLLDETVDARLQPYLASLGPDVTRLVADYPAGLGDPDVLRIAEQERRMLVTNDRDFAHLVFTKGHPHAGVIHLRFGSYAPLATKQDRLHVVLTQHTDQLDQCQFLVVTRTGVRVRQPQERPPR